MDKTFTFKCSEKDNELSAFNGLQCKVISKLGNYNFEDERESVYVVKFESGKKVDEFTEELIGIN